MAYVLGFMYADGTIVDSYKSSRAYYISFSSNDFQILSDIKEVLRSKHIIYTVAPRILSHKNTRYISKTGYVLRLGNRTMYEDLIKLGLSHRKSLVMSLPSMPDTYFSYYLRGYFDGDGCISITKVTSTSNRIRVVFTSGSTVFLSQLATSICRLIDVPLPHYYKSVGAFNLVLSGNAAIKVLDYLYNNIELSPSLKRKRKIYCDFLENSSKFNKLPVIT